MKKVFFTLGFALSVFFIFCQAARAAEIGNLLSQPAKKNGLEVEVKGEIVGLVIKDSDKGFWVNITDGSGTIGVYLPSKVAKAHNLKEWKGGAYSVKGTEVLVKGVFNSNCSEHGGDLDLHAREVKVISESQPVAHPLDVRKALMAFFLLLLALFVFFFLRP